MTESLEKERKRDISLPPTLSEETGKRDGELESVCRSRHLRDRFSDWQHLSPSLPLDLESGEEAVCVSHGFAALGFNSE